MKDIDNILLTKNLVSELENKDWIHSPFSELVETAFNNIRQELNGEIVSDKFIQEWEEHSNRLLHYWQERLSRYINASSDRLNDIALGRSIELKGEALTVDIEQDGKHNPPNLLIIRERNLEYDFISVPKNNFPKSLILAPEIEAVGQIMDEYDEGLAKEHSVTFKCGGITKIEIAKATHISEKVETPVAPVWFSEKINCEGLLERLR